MKTDQEITPNVFGEITIGESTSTYVAKNTQSTSKNYLQIKMYPTEPNNIISVELPSQTLSSKMLLSSFKGKITVNS